MGTYQGTIRNNALPCTIALCVCTLLYNHRNRAVRRARELLTTHARRYDAGWAQQLMSLPGFEDALRAHEASWDSVQQRAIVVPKHQTSASLYALFCEADRLNDLLQSKMYGLCRAHGGEFSASPVKNEVRALHKIFRTYHGDWRRLCDLSRCTLKFERLEALTSCLGAIGGDEEIEVVASSRDKNRLRKDYDASSNGGYRDVQLCVRLNTAEARTRGVRHHLAEVQLHLSAIAALKTGGGHAMYVLCRNLDGR